MELWNIGIMKFYECNITIHYSIIPTFHFLEYRDSSLEVHYSSFTNLMLVFPLNRFPRGYIDRFVIQFWSFGREKCQRVPMPILIIPFSKIPSRVGSSGLLSLQSARDHNLG